MLESGMPEGRGLRRAAEMTVPRPGSCLGVRAAVGPPAALTPCSLQSEGSVYQTSFSGAEALPFKCLLLHWPGGLCTAPEHSIRC